MPGAKDSGENGIDGPAAAAAEDPRRVITAAMGAREARAPLPSRAARQPRL